jgi:hypothetical protein
MLTTLEQTRFVYEGGDRSRRPLPPSPGVQFFRDGLFSQLFPHRDWRADRWVGFETPVVPTFLSPANAVTSALRGRYRCGRERRHLVGRNARGRFSSFPFDTSRHIFHLPAYWWYPFKRAEFPFIRVI